MLIKVTKIKMDKWISLTLIFGVEYIPNLIFLK